MSYFTPSGIAVTSQTVAGVSKETEKCWWGYKLVQPFWKTVCQSLKKLNKAMIGASNSTPNYLFKI